MFLTAALALSFFLGLAPGEQSFGGIIRDPIRSLIRSGIGLVSLIVYWQIQFSKGLWWQFLVFYTIAIGVYLMGRWAGGWAWPGGQFG